MAATIREAEGIVLSGAVKVDDRAVVKSGTLVSQDARVEIAGKASFVGRGGLKLSGALQAFQANVTDAICADVGCSTGGFTDALLQAGARKVYSIDVGYGDLAWNLRNDPRVVVMERTNACYLDALPEQIQFASVDVSLLSLRKVLPSVRKWLRTGGEIVALVKPQYEASKDELPEGAVITDSRVHAAILRRLLDWALGEGLSPNGLIASPITGMGGNQEFLLWLRPGTPVSIAPEDLIARCGCSV